MSDATHDVIVIGGGPGGYAAALYGAGAGLDVAVVEHNKVGGTCPARRLHPGQGAARGGLGVSHRGPGSRVRRDRLAAGNRLVGGAGPQAAHHRSAHRGPHRAPGPAQGDRLLRFRLPPWALGGGSRPRRRGLAHGRVRPVHHPGHRVGAPNDRRLRGGRPHRCDLRRVVLPGEPARFGGGDRRGRHRLRVRFDDGRPGSGRDRAGGASHHPRRVRRRRRQGGAPLVPQAGHRGAHRCDRARPRAPRRRHRHRRLLRGGQAGRRRPGGGGGWGGGPAQRAWGWTPPES